jgi:hypothetical protein
MCFGNKALGEADNQQGSRQFGSLVRLVDPSETKRRAPGSCQDEDIVQASWRHGEYLNKVAVPEGAAGSPPF